LVTTLNLAIMEPGSMIARLIAPALRWPHFLDDATEAVGVVGWPGWFKPRPRGMRYP